MTRTPHCFLLLCCLVSLASGQDVLQRIHLAPHSSARSEFFSLQQKSRLRVEPVQKGELNPAIFIYEQEGELVAKNDEDAESDAFEWSPAETTRCQFVFYSRTDQTVDYEIKRFSHEATRGITIAAKPVLAIVPVYFATNRQLDNRSPVRLGGTPTEHDALNFGKVEVRIPLNHRRGHIESPSFLHLEFTADESKHFVAKPAVLLDSVQAFQEISDLAARSDRHDALLFIHGYNTTFEDSAFRVAQLANDLKFQGPALLFSWPSQGHLVDYLMDQRNADLSARPLGAFLRGLAEQSHVTRIHVIAHSMGNRVLASALTKIDPLRSNIHQIALLAPDFDAALFEQLAREFPKNIGPIALYASSKDRALAASASLAGYTRLGQVGSAMTAIPGIESIDASTVDTSVFTMGHDYYATNLQILGDLYSFFAGLPPPQRFSLRQSTDGRYWVLIP
jgi:esterase/lipase superfamily enzyme